MYYGIEVSYIKDLVLFSEKDSVFLGRLEDAQHYKDEVVINHQDYTCFKRKNVERYYYFDKDKRNEAITHLVLDTESGAVISIMNMDQTAANDAV